MTSVDAALRLETGTMATGPATAPGVVSLRKLRSDPAAVIGLALLVLVLVAVLGAPWLSPFDPIETDTGKPLAAPSWAHPLGTDGLGRDMLARILHGGRTSILTAVVATLGIGLLGLFLGAVSGLLGGAVDALVMRVVEVLQALPLLIVAMVAAGLLGGGTDKLVLTVILLGWTTNARAVRSVTLSIRERPFLEAARAQGASQRRILFRHVVPSVLSTVAALSMIELGRIALALSALSFLGFGVQPPTPEWGAMLANARSAFYAAPQLLVYPGLAITLFVLAVNLVGDGVRDALDGRTGHL